MEPQRFVPRAVSADWLRALMRTAAVTPASTRTLPDVVEEAAARAPDDLALLAGNGAMAGEAAVPGDMTYRALAAFTNRIARWALAQGLAPGDRVALMMTNEPAFVAIWLGLTRVGVVVALVDPSLNGGGLRHCLALAAPRCLIVGAGLSETAAAALAGEAATIPIIAYRGDGSHPALERLLATLSDLPLTLGEGPPLTLRDQALLVYTSGTTGLPKAAHVSHGRVMMWSQWFAGIIDARPGDRLYNCLPMHHSIGGVAATGAMLAAGGCVIVRRTFSARRFWPDVSATGATLFPYIGELCRYLLAAPPGASDTTHRLRLCFGNGLRADVWKAFEARFAIPRIVEFYAATEGSFSLFNLEGKPGAIGRIPSFMAHRSPVALVRFDPADERPARGDDGFCQRCGLGEAGEALGRLDAGTDGRFEGYTDAAESERKVMRDVFAKGDAWFRTGDLMRRDAAGFFTFVDRIGDTFRWHGENVSTAAVAEAVCAAPGVAAASVYGVAVSGTEGRAGMAALVTGEGFDLPTLHRHLAATLARHARPLFLRLVRELPLTATFKPQKARLVAEGFDPAGIGDPLYRDGGDGYVPLDAADHAAIVAGAVRV